MFETLLHEPILIDTALQTWVFEDAIYSTQTTRNADYDEIFDIEHCEDAYIITVWRGRLVNWVDPITCEDLGLDGPYIDLKLITPYVVRAQHTNGKYDIYAADTGKKLSDCPYDNVILFGDQIWVNVDVFWGVFDKLGNRIRPLSNLLPTRT
jgi:hypothetical protein